MGSDRPRPAWNLCPSYWRRQGEVPGREGRVTRLEEILGGDSFSGGPEDAEFPATFGAFVRFTASDME